MFGLSGLVRAITEFATELQSFTAWLRSVRQDAEIDYETAKRSRTQYLEGEALHETADTIAANGTAKSSRTKQRA